MIRAYETYTPVEDSNNVKKNADEVKEGDISLLHRSGAALGASVVSAVVVNPLDVVKVRCSAAAVVVLGGGGGAM